MNTKILQRFIAIVAVSTIAMFVFWDVIDDFVKREPGDYHTEVGDIRLKSGKYEDALKEFNLALKEQPNHRGALMGRALVFIQTKKYKDAIAELDYLIDFLNKTLKADDLTGHGTLAAAYANRGIVHDREGRYKRALEDYVSAIKTDEGAVDGPGLMHKILYGNSRPSTVRKRAQYIHKQLQLPPEKRLLRVPEIDDIQRMYKP